MEKKFALAMEGTGLELRPGGSIECYPPVENKNGEPVKRVTAPDFTVMDELGGRTMRVEITKGNGNNPHKAAQLRVVEQAREQATYKLLTGDQVEKLADTEDPIQRKELLCGWFGWSDTYSEDGEL